MVSDVSTPICHLSVCNPLRRPLSLVPLVGYWHTAKALSSLFELLQETDWERYIVTTWLIHPLLLYILSVWLVCISSAWVLSAGIARKFSAILTITTGFDLDMWNVNETSLYSFVCQLWSYKKRVRETATATSESYAAMHWRCSWPCIMMRSPAALLMTFVFKILLWEFWYRREWGNGELQEISGTIYLNFPDDVQLSTLFCCDVIFCLGEIQHSLESFLRHAPFYKAVLFVFHPFSISHRFTTTFESGTLRNTLRNHSKWLSIDCSLYTSVNDSFLLAWGFANSTSVTNNVITLIQKSRMTRGSAQCSQIYTVLRHNRWFCCSSSCSYTINLQHQHLGN